MPTHPDGSRLSRDQLLADYQGYARPESDWLIGGEFERHLLREDGTPVPFFGEHGVQWLLDQLAQRHDWKRVHEGEHLVALAGHGASVTLEPGCQFELSGAPFVQIADLANEAKGFTRQVQAILDEHGAPFHQVALGFTPWADVEDIGFVPKARYDIMGPYLRKTGKLAHHMMKGTAAIQATYDFADEEDCARKVGIATRLGPLTVALFANSPLSGGQPNGFMSFRNHIWGQTDPDRTGIPDASEGFTYARWVDYLLDVPMMFTKHGGVWSPAYGRTFREWMDDGIEGVYPNRGDWDLHLTSVFPEVRVKRGIEVRGADCVSTPMALAFVALFKGLFYCGRATGEAVEIAERFSRADTRDQRFDAAARGGLQGQVGGRPLADWAAELLDATWGGLGRCAPHEQALLRPLVDTVERGVSPAADVLASWKADPTPRGVIRACEMTG